MAFLIHQWGNYFHLPLTLSGFSFGTSLIPDILHPRRLFLVCPCCPGSNHFVLDSNILDLGPIEQANIRYCSLARVVSPNLTSLGFSGDVKYLEDVLSQIETPMLIQSDFWFFNRLVFDTPLLGHFIRRTETFMTIYRARIHFFSWAVKVKLSGQEETANNGREALQLKISCKLLDWQLSAVAQILNPFLSSFSALEILEIAISPEDWQGKIEVTQWREFLRPFTSVKEMSLKFKDSVWVIAPALQELAEETTEVLPALQNLVLWMYPWQPSGPVKEAIDQFVATQQLYGHPVTIHY